LVGAEKQNNSGKKTIFPSEEWGESSTLTEGKKGGKEKNRTGRVLPHLSKFLKGAERASVSNPISTALYEWILGSSKEFPRL